MNFSVFSKWIPLDWLFLFKVGSSPWLMSQNLRNFSCDIFLGQNRVSLKTFFLQKSSRGSSRNSVSIPIHVSDPQVTIRFSGLKDSLEQSAISEISSGVNATSQSSNWETLPLNPWSTSKRPPKGWPSCSCPRTNDPPAWRGM